MIAPKGATTLVVTTVDEGAATARLKSLHFDILARIKGIATPGTIGQLMRRALASRTTACARAFDRLVGILGAIRRGIAPHPEADAERLRAPLGWIFATDNFAGADEGGGALELL